MHIEIDITKCVEAIMTGLVIIAFFRYVIGEK